MKADKTDNELIAEFMGLKPERCRLTPLHKYRVYWCLSSSGIGVISDMLKYNTSWDWLMPVVQKITNIYCEDYENTWTHEEEKKFKSVLDIKLSVASTPDRDNENEGIEFVHAKVVEFIKWYSLNHTKP